MKTHIRQQTKKCKKINQENMCFNDGFIFSLSFGRKSIIKIDISRNILCESCVCVWCEVLTDGKKQSSTLGVVVVIVVA